MPRQRRRRKKPAPAVQLPELAASRYYPWLADLEKVSAWKIAARLPSLIRTTLAWSWKASRRDTAAALALNTAAALLLPTLISEIWGSSPSLRDLLTAASIPTDAGAGGTDPGFEQQTLM
ncbi:hypothetical protein HNR23_002198 [Nocardiopsis mwathae]|uniref:Uncharacterized protein n=1 Tax=Nocardiopsis mwathae TaxID=1472723 RepID=A0A7W9YHC3_9ACTN|nr:hypothetical protein [Nocardiopsis mwathae]MBB6172138.1 hypothetical protein [Nocardiopsis mwathae]